MPDDGEPRRGPSRRPGAPGSTTGPRRTSGDAGGDEHDRDDEAAEADDPAEQQSRCRGRADRRGRGRWPGRGATPATIRPMPTNSCSRPSTAPRSSSVVPGRAGAAPPAGWRWRRRRRPAGRPAALPGAARDPAGSEPPTRAATALAATARRGPLVGSWPSSSSTGPRWSCRIHRTKGVSRRPAIALSRDFRSRGRRDCTAPSAASVTSRVPPSVGLHAGRVLHGAARAAGDGEQHDVGVRQVVGDPVEDRRRVERDGRRRRTCCPRRVAGGAGSATELAADVDVRRHAASPPRRRHEQVDDLRRGVDLEVLLRAARARPRRRRSPARSGRRAGRAGASSSSPPQPAGTATASSADGDQRHDAATVDRLTPPSPPARSSGGGGCAR